MKKLFLLSALLAIPALAGTITQSCGNDTSKIEPLMFSFALPAGDTESDIRQPFHLDRLECAFLASGSFKLERVRNLENIPYIDHRTNDGSVVGWKVTDGTTFDEVVESFSGKIELNGGGGRSDDFASSPFMRLVDGDDGPTLLFYGGYIEDSRGRPGFSPSVRYSFASNALYLAETADRPDLWTRVGEPGALTYEKNLVVFDRYPNYRMAHSGDAVVYRSGSGAVTNWLNEAADRLNVYGDLVFSRVDLPSGLLDEDGNEVPVSFARGHVVTNFAVWSSCSMAVTNVLVDASVGTEFSTNLADAVVLPKDVLRVSGSAMPTGHVIGIGRK